MKNWEKKKLGEVLEKTETVDPTKKPNEEFIYLDVSSVNKETKEIENATVLLGKDAPSRARKLIRKNDVIFATVRPTHSRVALITEEYDEQVCSTGYFVLRGKDFVFNQYLFYFLLTNEFNEQMEKLQKGASYPAVTDTEVKSILLHYPKSLPEQQRIVAILDEAFAAIAKAKANAQQNLKNAKELFESYLQGVFENKGEGWEEKTLGEMIEIKNGKNQQTVLSETGKYKVMGSAGNVMGYATDYICEAGTTIIGRKGNISKPIYINEKFWNVDTAFGFYPKNENDIDKRFVYYLCLGIDFKSMNRGTTIPSLVKSELQTIQINFPKYLKTQQTIVEKLDALSAETKKLENIYQQKINDLEELKKSVLQKAFSGELSSPKGVIDANDGYSPSKRV